MAQYCGLSWEADFWRVLSAVISTHDNLPQEKINTRSSLQKENYDLCKTEMGETGDVKHLDMKFDLACENIAYAKYQRQKLCLHESKCRYETIQGRNGSKMDIDAMVIKNIIL